MNKIKIFLVGTLIFVFLSTVTTKAFVSSWQLDLNAGELLNNRAVKLVKPLYPAEARENKVQGIVLVKIEVNEMGKVTEAEMIEGDSIFKKACEKSALASIFKPKISDGKKVKFSGSLRYSFSLFP